jgi:hypothetical protein
MAGNCGQPWIVVRPGPIFLLGQDLVLSINTGFDNPSGIALDSSANRFYVREDQPVAEFPSYCRGSDQNRGHPYDPMVQRSPREHCHGWQSLALRMVRFRDTGVEHQHVGHNFSLSASSSCCLRLLRGTGQRVRTFAPWPRPVTVTLPSATPTPVPSK